MVPFHYMAHRNRLNSPTLWKHLNSHHSKYLYLISEDNWGLESALLKSFEVEQVENQLEFWVKLEEFFSLTHTADVMLVTEKVF